MAPVANAIGKMPWVRVIMEWVAGVDARPHQLEILKRGSTQSKDHRAVVGSGLGAPQRDCWRPQGELSHQLAGRGVNVTLHCALQVLARHSAQHHVQLISLDEHLKVRGDGVHVVSRPQCQLQRVAVLAAAHDEANGRLVGDSRSARVHLVCGHQELLALLHRFGAQVGCHPAVRWGEHARGQRRIQRRIQRSARRGWALLGFLRGTLRRRRLHGHPVTLLSNEQSNRHESRQDSHGNSRRSEGDHTASVEP